MDCLTTTKIYGSNAYKNWQTATRHVFGALSECDDRAVLDVLRAELEGIGERLKEQQPSGPPIVRRII